MTHSDTLLEKIHFLAIISDIFKICFNICLILFQSLKETAVTATSSSRFNGRRLRQLYIKLRDLWAYQYLSISNRGDFTSPAVSSLNYMRLCIRKWTLHYLIKFWSGYFSIKVITKRWLVPSWLVSAQTNKKLMLLSDYLSNSNSNSLFHK